MWPYIIRRILYNIPVYLGIILLMMLALRVSDPVSAYLGKNASVEQVEAKRKSMGLDKPFAQQYAEFVWRVARMDFDGTPDEPYSSWKYEGQAVGQKLREAIGPSLSIMVPELILTTIISISIGLVSAFNRGRWLDRTLMVLVVLGMSISVLVFIILGQYFGAYWLNQQLTWRGEPVELFAISGYERWTSWSSIDLGFMALPYPDGVSPGVWAHYCLLPVLIGVVVAMGYDTRFYRAVMVEESSRDYITTAVAKGATTRKIMFVHMLKNAMIPIITRIMITLPFLVTGSILLETYFRVPGMGKLLIDAITNRDFPIVQTFTAIFALLFIASNILTDVLYALVDPRVRLS
jgi:peptide/nickel transport system permease protein